MNRDNIPGNPNRENDSGQDKNLEKVVQFEGPQSVQSQASAWLAKLDGNDPSEEDLQAFKQWVNQDKAHILAFEKATAAWDELNVLARLPLELQQRTLNQQRASQLNKRNLFHRKSYAAVTLAIILVIFVRLKSDIQPPVREIHWTAVGEQKSVVLSDNSVVQLNTNSRLKVDYSSSTRAIFLHQGEAHFDVEHQPDRPFEVYAGTGRVRAVGTAFSVRLDVQEIDVLVTEGIVEIAPEIISSPDAPAVAQEKHSQLNNTAALHEPVRLEAGETAVFNRDKIKLVQQIEKEEIQRRLAWQEGLLVFNGEALEEVVAQVSRYTDTIILIKSEKARKLRVGGQFKVGDTRAIFSALEKGFGLKADYVTDSLVYLSYYE